MHYIPSGDCTGQHSSTTRRMYDYHAGNVYNRKCEHKYEYPAKICITLPMIEEKKNRHYNIQIYQWSYLLPKHNRGKKVVRLEKSSFLLFQISMLLTHLPFSYRMSLSYCLSTLFSPVLWIPDYIRHTLDHRVYLLVGASIPSIFFTSTLYLLILVFSNSAFQCSSSYFRSDLPTLWPFRWIFTSMTSFQGVLSIFFLDLDIQLHHIWHPSVCVYLLVWLWGGYPRLPLISFRLFCFPNLLRFQYSPSLCLFMLCLQNYFLLWFPQLITGFVWGYLVILPSCMYHHILLASAKGPEMSLHQRPVSRLKPKEGC